MTDDSFTYGPIDRTHAFIQWKGTDVCMDFYCDCGVDFHIDAFFAYAIKCPSCGSIWEMPWHLFPRKVKSHDRVIAGELDEE